MLQRVQARRVRPEFAGGKSQRQNQSVRVGGVNATLFAAVVQLSGLPTKGVIPSAQELGKMKRWITGMVGGSALLFISPAAWAVGKGPCAADIERVCHDVKPGKGRYRACLKQHENELSEAGKKHLAQPRKHMRRHKHQ